MRAQTINLLYATFEESIKRLGSFPLDELPKIKDLAKTKKIKTKTPKEGKTFQKWQLFVKDV